MSASGQYIDSISLPDVLSIRNVSDLKQRITESFSSNNSVILDIPENAEADLSFIQLVESARRQAKAANKTLALGVPAKGHVLKVLERAGFIEAFNGDDTKFWLHKEVTR
ncbi:STAS domain-containing protein [Rhizobium sp. S96]|uniref:STAS domain-containing protein n=1 Tax=Rhizobium sp. S96 TaxID=3055140 RepID=UPI0025AB39FB|nr:STAS domain-containing protein [Rhizobium sp. S96]MDM9620222.1 STAS domain-containing protein [Rhizobium sp. S96]